MKLSTYWHALVGTFTSFHYYVSVIRAPFWFTTRFFALSMLALGQVFAIRLQAQVFPSLLSQFERVSTEIISHFPQDRMIEWTGERLSLTPAESWIVSYPSAVQIERRSFELPPHAATLLPHEPSEEPSALAETQSFMVVGPETLRISDLQGGWQKTQLSTLLGKTAFVVSSKTLPGHLETARSWVENTLRATKWLSLVIVPLVLLFHGLWLGLIESFLAYFLFRLNGLHLPFAKVFQISLHLVVVAETLNQIALWLYPQLSFPMFSIAYWLVLIGILLTQRKALSAEYMPHTEIKKAKKKK